MLPAKAIMTTEVKSVTPDTHIFEALSLLTKNKISGAPVIDENQHVVGILSEKDVLKILIDQNLDINDRVSDYMSRDIISFEESDSATSICQLFINSHIRRVPIVKEKKLVGIVSRRDIVNYILEAKTKMGNFRFD